MANKPAAKLSTKYKNPLIDLVLGENSRFKEEKSKITFKQLKKIETIVPGAKEDLLNLASKAGTKVTNPKSYSNYMKVKELIDEGRTIYAICRILRIPYTTCYVYSKMTPEQIERLKELEERPTEYR
jgi:hypothetical protein